MSVPVPFAKVRVRAVIVRHDLVRGFEVLLVRADATRLAFGVARFIQETEPFLVAAGLAAREGAGLAVAPLDLHALVTEADTANRHLPAVWVVCEQVGVHAITLSPETHAWERWASLRARSEDDFPVRHHATALQLLARHPRARGTP